MWTEDIGDGRRVAAGGATCCARRFARWGAIAVSTCNVISDSKQRLPRSVGSSVVAGSRTRVGQWGVKIANSDGCGQVSVASPQE